MRAIRTLMLVMLCAACNGKTIGARAGAPASFTELSAADGLKGVTVHGPACLMVFQGRQELYRVEVDARRRFPLQVRTRVKPAAGSTEVITALTLAPGCKRYKDRLLDPSGKTGCMICDPPDPEAEGCCPPPEGPVPSPTPPLPTLEVGRDIPNLTPSRPATPLPAPASPGP